MTILEFFEANVADESILGAMISANEDILEEDITEHIEEIYFKDVHFNDIHKIVESEKYPPTNTFFVRVNGIIDLDNTTLLNASFDEIEAKTIKLGGGLRSLRIENSILEKLHINELNLNVISIFDCKIKDFAIYEQPELLELSLHNNKIDEFDIDEESINGLDFYECSSTTGLEDAEGSEGEELKKWFLRKKHLNNDSIRRGEASISDTGLFDFKN